MTIQLPPDIEASIRREIELGRYLDAEDVVRAAMRLLVTEERRLDALRAMIDVGLEEADRGETDEWTPELRDRLWKETLDELWRGIGERSGAVPPEEIEAEVSAAREEVRAMRRARRATAGR